MPAYNVQSTVDDASHFILTCEVTDSPIDIELLEPNMTTLKEQLDIVPQMVRADCGYANEEQIQSLEQQGIECIVPFQEEPAVKKIERENGITFTYDEKTDTFQCPQGKKLLLVSKNRKFRKHLYNEYRCKECDQCPVKQKCTKSKSGRTVLRRLDGEWLRTHKEKVQVEMDLYSTGYNLIRLKNVEIISLLFEKLAQWNPVTGFFALLSNIFTKKKQYYLILCS